MSEAPARHDDGYEHACYLERSHYCPDCKDRARIVVRRNFETRRDEAVCGGCGRRECFVKRKSITQVWRENPEAVPVEIANTLARKYGVEPMSEQAIVTASETQMAKRIEQARWLAELKPQDRASLAHLSVKYGLDPLMKEMTLYEGFPYITTNGLIRIAHRQKEFAGLEDRPMTSEEKAAYGYKAPVCWMVKVYRTDWKCAAVGTGTADPNNPLRNNPVERVRPEWLARSRAMRQALKLAFPHSLPFEEVEAAEERGIDLETGEIIEGPTAIPTVSVVGPIAVEPIPEVEETTIETGAPAEPVRAEADLRKSVASLARQVGFKPELWAHRYAKEYSEPFESATYENLVACEKRLADQLATKT